MKDQSILTSYVNVNGIRTHYVEKGHGDPVVLVHGFGPGGSGYYGWNRTIHALAEHYHVYALDCLGFGETLHPGVDYTDQAILKHLSGFIDVLCLEKVRLGGNSRGGFMSARYTVDNPDRVHKLLLVSSGSIAAAMGVHRPRTEAMEAAQKAIRGYDGTKESMRRWMETIMVNKENITDELLEERLRMAALPGAKEARESMERYNKKVAADTSHQQWRDLTHRLPRLTMPIKMVWGKLDAFAPVEMAEELRTLLPNVDLEIFENAGHQSQNDEVERFNRVALQFFAD